MIVKTKLHHLQEIYNIEQNSFEYPWSRDQIINDIKSTINNGNRVYLDNNKVIGYIFGFKIIDEFHINNLAVHPLYLRKNIATKLISYISNKINIIYLEVSSNNIIAQKCYESLCFKLVGKRKKYYKNGQDAILYNMDLIKNG